MEKTSTDIRVPLHYHGHLFVGGRNLLLSQGVQRCVYGVRVCIFLAACD